MNYVISRVAEGWSKVPIPKLTYTNYLDTKEGLERANPVEQILLAGTD